MNDPCEKQFSTPRKILRYVLDGRNAVPCADLEEWVRKFGFINRRVAETLVGDVRISTVFLGIDHSFDGGPPLLFETMIFGGARDQHQERCSTWEQAEDQHAAAVRSTEKDTVAQ